MLFVLNLNSNHRKVFYANKMYIIYTTSIFIFVLMWITFKDSKVLFGMWTNFGKVFNLKIDEVNRWITVSFTAFDFLLTIGFEYMIDKIMK